jgi:Ca-activated chloride channel homolog
VTEGETTVTVTIGSAKATEVIALAAGEKVEKDIIAGSGLAVVTPFYVEGMKVEGDGPYVEVLEAKAAIDGTRKQVAYGYGTMEFSLPPGDFIARVALEAAEVEVPFTVKIAERVEIAGILNAGILAATGAGVEGYEIFDAAASSLEDRVVLGYGYGETLQLTLPPGDYTVSGQRGETKSEVPFTIKAGERTEVVIP